MVAIKTVTRTKQMQREYLSFYDVLCKITDFEELCEL